MTSPFNFGGYGVQGSDPNLQDKIAKLKSGKKNAQARITDYLEREMGIDRRELAFNTRMANDRVAELLNADNVNRARLVGNSMGIKHVELINEHHVADIPCPSCQSTNGFWDETHGDKGTWYCEDCESASEENVPENKPTLITEKNHGSSDWHDWERAYKAYVQQAETDGSPAYTFEVQQTYGTPIEPVPVRRNQSTDINSYKPGTILRIQRRIIGEADATHDETHYVTVGGIFDDEGVTILDTMQPMTDLTGWSVIEEL